jgi:hypothetical protein
VADHVIDLGWGADGHFLAAVASTGMVSLFDAKAGTSSGAGIDSMSPLRSSTASISPSTPYLPTRLSFIIRRISARVHLPPNASSKQSATASS